MKNPSEEYKTVRLPDAMNGSPEINFAQITNTVLRDKSISHKARGILCALLSNGEGWTSYKEKLQSDCDGGSSINSGLKELEKAGYLWRVQYVDKRTKQRAGSFWSYTQVPWKHDIKKHEKWLDDKGFEIWAKSFKQINELYEAREEKPEVENLNMAFLNMENLPLRIPTLKNSKKEEDTTSCSGGEKTSSGSHKRTEPPIPYEDIKDAWNIITANTPIKPITKMSDSRKKHIKSRLEDFPTITDWKRLFRKAVKTPFLCGDGPRGWIVSFDWIISNDNNPAKVMEETYNNGNKKQGGIKQLLGGAAAIPGKYDDVKTIVIDNTKF